MTHKQIGWDTVAAGIAISFVTAVKVPMVPPPVVAMVIGAVASPIIQPGFGFGAEIFFYLMLPPIILRSGLQFKWAPLNGVWKTTLLLSIVATIFSSFIIFTGCSLLTTEGHTKCLRLGSVLSSTDPIATVALMKHAHVQDHIKHVLQGEALTNDAVAAMLTHAAEKQQWSASSAVLDIIVGILISISVGSVGGYACGGFSNTITVLGIATTLYALCEILQASGILCIFLFAITSRWRQQSKQMEDFVNIVADLADLYCMFAVGAEIVFITGRAFVTATVLFLSAMAARIVSVQVLARLTGEKWTFSELFTLGIAGARGTLAYALARSVGADTGPIVLCVVLLSTAFNFIVLIL